MKTADIQQALERRAPGALVEALAAINDWQPDKPSRALYLVLHDCTIFELKQILNWAEDWLSDFNHDCLRARGDSRWAAMNSLYQHACYILQTHGVRVARAP